MNFLEIAKLVMNGEKIVNLPLRVCFYARVSTESDNQLNSLENQQSYYENYIKSKPNWTYVNGYIDEGISGVRVEKRWGFKKMIDDAKKGKFDLIITKEVSRFARDLEDSIHYIRILKNANVGIYFENQNLNTFDANSELILNIMFNLAQDESRKLSGRIKFGHMEAIKKGHVLGSSNIIGYKKENCKLVIVPSEAKLVRKIFELYASGNYGLYKLAKVLASLNYYNKNGNYYDKDTLKRIISNPKYKGYYRGKTSEVIDYRTKKRIKISEDKQVIYRANETIIPPIVAEELWNKANDILKIRTKNYQNNNSFNGGLKYAFSSKLYCKYHNTNFQRSHGSKKKRRPVWCCGMYLKYRLMACETPIIAEADLYKIMDDIMKKIPINKKKIVNDLYMLYKDIENFNQDDDLQNIEDNISRIEDKKTMALDLVFNKDLTKDELKIQFKKYEKELNILIRQKEDILREKENILNFKKNRLDIKKYIENELEYNLLEDFIKKFLDEIIVSKIDNDRYRVHLDIYLNLNDLLIEKNKGAKHLNGSLDNEILYIDNKNYVSKDAKRKDKKRNNYNYNVYLETL